MNEMDQALSRYFELASKCNEHIRDQRPIGDALVRQTALAAALALRAYCLPSNWEGERPIRPIPLRLASDMARNIQLICDGHLPNWMLHLIRRGAPSTDPRVKKAQGLAVAYIKLCKRKVILNSAPTKHVAGLFGVSNKQVQNWTNAFVVEPEDFFPNASDDSERAALISEQLVVEGATYKLWGRGPKNSKPLGKRGRRPGAKR